jgi:anthranilate synthase/aminodeoxychorismate synthase-like glutamine amidotransferase
VPILGVCLGHQIIVHALGGRIVRAREPMHGKISPVHHDGQGVFRGLAQPLAAMRYHSLIADDSCLPASLQVTSQTADGVIMGVRHRVWPMVGLQFHPESVGTPDGSRILANFLDV